MRTALIFGRAKGVWDEMAAAQELGKFDHIIGVGSAGVDCPQPFDIWVSFHHLMFLNWLSRRKQKGLPIPVNYWSSKHRGSPHSIGEGRGMPFKVNFIDQEGGSSGLVAVMVALRGLYVDRVVLAGIPMTSEGGQYDTGVDWIESKHHRLIWERDLDKIKGKVKSMSGWTQEVLGAPTADWLKGVECVAA